MLGNPGKAQIENEHLKLIGQLTNLYTLYLGSAFLTQTAT